MQANKKTPKVLTPKELSEAIQEERDWLKENNAVSAVTEGPVEDLEGVPMVANEHKGMPAIPNHKTEQ